ncbi:hypothetical protein ABBQ38_008302 [Trebouxia sp. C0009 RCD-2024]
MRPGLRSALVLLKKHLDNDLRSHRCQSLPGGTGGAVVPESKLAALFKGTTLHKVQALPLGPFTSALPSNVQGGHLYQHHLVSHFSAQHQRTQQEGPDISLLDPALQKQWDHDRNAHLGNVVIKPFCGQRVWWACNKCPEGHLHSWSALVQDRSNGTGCPQCSGCKVCKHNSLATRAPQVAAQWDYEANSGTPESILAHSSQVCGWCCDACGHKWRLAPVARVRKGGAVGCPVCATTTRRTKHPTFAESRHPLLAEWDHMRNTAQGNTPDNVTLQSNKQIFWLCMKCPAGQEHSWSAMPCNRTSCNQTGCPFCAGRAACKCNSLLDLYPEAAAEWDHSKNTDQPGSFPAHSNSSAWWCDPNRGSWEQTIHSRAIGQQRRNAHVKRTRQKQRLASNQE